LIGASYFMPPRAAVEALANGTAPPPFQPSSDAAAFLDRGLAHLTDPLYMGFDGMFLASFLFATNDPRAPSVAEAAVQHNPAANDFGRVVGDVGSSRPRIARGSRR
jgi:hypothetical protein